MQCYILLHRRLSILQLPFHHLRMCVSNKLGYEHHRRSLRFLGYSELIQLPRLFLVSNELLHQDAIVA